MKPNPRLPTATDPDARLAETIGSLERRVRAMESQLSSGAVPRLPVVVALPAAGRQGRVMMLASDSSVWKDTGTTWTLV